MNRRMLEVEVEIDDKGLISIKQPDSGSDEAAWIYVTADQVDVLIAWLQEAKAEVLARQTSRAER